MDNKTNRPMRKRKPGDANETAYLRSASRVSGFGPHYDDINWPSRRKKHATAKA